MALNNERFGDNAPKGIINISTAALGEITGIK